MAGLLVVADKTVTVEPGGEATCVCKIKNTGTIVDQFSLQVLGAAAAFTTSEPQSVSLFPGNEGEVTLRIKPPPTQRAGQLPLGIKLISAVEPAATVVEEATLQIGAFVAITARIVPRVEKGRSVGKHTIVLRNTGNAPTKVRINGSDPDDLIRFRGLGQSIPLAPGAPQRIKIRYRSTASHMTGPPESHPFTLSVVPERGDPVPVDGAFLQRAAISGWMIIAFAGIIAFIALVLILKSLQNGNIKTQAQSAGALGLNSPTPSASASAAASTAVTSSAAQTSGGGAKPPPPPPTQSTGNGGGGGLGPQPSGVVTNVGLLYVHTTGLFSADVYTLAGSPPAPVDLTNDSGQDFLSPSLSPNGLQVAYSAFAAGNPNARSVWIGDNHLKSPSPRVLDCGKCQLVAWSYDGSLIAFATATGTLEVVPATGSVPPQPVFTAPGPITSIAWTRDSKAIGFTTGGTVQAIGRSGGSPVTLASGSNANGVTFSPDGHFVAYGLATSGSATQIVIGNIDASFKVSGQRNVTNGGTNQFPMWTRDNKTIYYAGTDANNFELWDVPAAGGAPKQLTNDATAPSSGNVSSTEPTG